MNTKTKIMSASVGVILSWVLLGGCVPPVQQTQQPPPPNPGPAAMVSQKETPSVTPAAQKNPAREKAPTAHEVLRSGESELHLSTADGIQLRHREILGFSSPRPMQAGVLDAQKAEVWLGGKYETIRRIDPDQVVCEGTLTTTNATQFGFTDTLTSLKPSGSFRLQRTVKVVHADPRDVGFSSRFGFETAEKASLSDLMFFAPGIWYGRNDGARGIGSSERQAKDSFFLFRESRCPAPFFMAQTTNQGVHVTLAQNNPDSVVSFTGDDFLPLINDLRIQEGSFGLHKAPSPEIFYQFPASEGEHTYITGSADAWARRSHPVKEGVQHGYDLILRLEQDSDYLSAMRDTWRFFYDHYKPKVIPANLEDAYTQSLDLLFQLAVPRGPREVPGIPFCVFVESGKVENPSYQMGFIGMQHAAAFHLLRHGRTKERPDYVKRGTDIIQFWVDHSFRNESHRLPSSWYAGGWGENWELDKNKSFLRNVAEGTYDILRAYEMESKYGTAHPDWLAYGQRFGDWLLESQSEDGSWNNRYSLEGSPVLDQGPAPSGTLFPVPLLLKLHGLTGKQAYLDAALKAGDFGYREFYLKGVYRGGAVDNPNVMDKEAALMNFRSFLALYDVTKEERWLEAAKSAALFGETWTYVWDVPIPPEFYEFYKTFFRPGFRSTGLGLVATGLSYADWYAARHAGDFYRLYQITGDEHYKQVSDILLHNTKQTMDIQGSIAEGRYGRPGLQVEGMDLVIVRGKHNKLWLPFVTTTHLEGMTQVEELRGKPTP